MDEKICPYCAETIRADAVKCRFCGSWLAGRLRDPREWHRSVPDRKLAGVCAALAANLGVSVSVVRLVFVVLTLWHGMGILLYVLLWLMLPPEPESPSVLDGLLESLRRVIAPPDRDRSNGSHRSYEEDRL